MKRPAVVTIDFETKKIEGRPVYPPVPVGVAIKYPDAIKRKPKYWAWGHPTGNNCTLAEGKKALKEAWSYQDQGLLFHNSKFDVDVAVAHMGVVMPKWDDIHDTLFLVFLDDPHQSELGLKPSAERLLKMPPDERDEVMEWLLKHQPVPGVKISKSKQSDHYWAKYISEAPGDLVGRYAIGDVQRTEGLFKLLWNKTRKREMLKAYDRERRLMPILLEMEQTGLPVNLDKLSKDVRKYNTALERVDWWLRKTLDCTFDVNLDSGEQLIKAMIACGKCDEDKLPRTAGGKASFSKESLLQGVEDKELLAVLKYRTQLKTCLQTFMRPWLETAKKSGGLIYTSWNQVRQPSGDHNMGTRTGRLSSTPNFQNIPKEFVVIPFLPKALKLPALPQIRSYVIPFKGHVLIDRDYSQQEPRILGHFEGGSLLTQYQENPWLDVHDNAQAELAKAGRIYERRPVKNTNLGLIYGMGVGKLAIKNDMAVQEAKTLKEAILNLYPGLKDMYKDMKFRARNNIPIRTWGGREYYCEAPKIIDGRLRTFDYKMINVLIQGSAADCTKEAIIRFHARKRKDTHILLNVHDQLTASAPVKYMASEMQVLLETMESIEFEVKMLTEGTTGYNWEDLIDYDKRGKRVA